MKILALDTTTEACSAAVWMEGEIIECYQWAPRRHAELILPMIAAVLAEAGLSPTQLDALAFGRGPGAFTGVRIAAGVAQGIAFAAELPVMRISTLAAIAQGMIREQGATQVAVAIDARRREVYWATYQASEQDGVLLLGEEQVCAPTVGPVPELGAWIGAGSGWMVYADVLSQRLGIEAYWGERYPQARDIAVLGALAYQRGETVPVEQALPVYLRDKVT